ncbi:DGQHR domain-containing protein [Flavobacteriales bacterium]|jgi:DNA sulfur modification protein DndB|nr:DGQHR domain-containing protein [Flavobacteriales bacterium]
MDENTKISLLGKLVADKELKKELNIRKKDSVFESVSKKLREEYLDNGWSEDKEFKTKFRFKKAKSQDVFFEDQVWSLLAELGFEFLNKDRNFNLPYDKNGNTQQIDIIAKDHESVLIVECKAANEIKSGDFKKDLEAYKLKIGGIQKSVQGLFPNSKLKFKFIFATKNYHVGKIDLKRIENIGGIHFDEEIIQYYHDLKRQIGLAARYQLLGTLFDGQEIPEMENKIPAVKGKMGKHTYYSFSIEPEKLLKIGYVLHRNKANKNMMPTYQRLIKKSRLKSIREFINNGGYFPNSIIVSLDGPKKGLNFDHANTQVKSAIASVGVLHLPKKYRSAYIIDGQHRLYGYSESDYRSTNSIPVVAFENLDQDEQVKLFMDINGQQKAVPKNLRNTLEADLEWGSENLLMQMKAIKSKIALELGENKSSPLYNRIQIGENKKTNLRCITMEAVKLGLNNSNFLGKVSKNKIEETGTFYKGDLQDCFDKLSDYIIKCYKYLVENIKDEWSLGSDGIAGINRGVTGYIMFLSSIVDHLNKEGICNNKTSVNKLFEETKTFIDSVIHFYREIKPSNKKELLIYGGGGDKKYFRTLQIAAKEDHKKFVPPGLEEYLKKEAKEHNDKAISIIRDLELFLKKDFKERLEEKFDRNWWKKGTPADVYDKAELDASRKNREVENEEDEVSPWDCLTIIAYRKIALKTWRDIFEEHYTKPGEEKIRGGKEEKTKWMQKLERIRNKNFHTYSVTEEEIGFLQSLHDWLITKSINT